MDLEFVRVAAELPMAASLAVAGGLVSLREVRRRTALNEAMHELRRPLQVLALSLPEEQPRSNAARSSLALATAALDRLDREINGREVESRYETVMLRPLLEAALARWRPRARASGRSLRLQFGASPSAIHGDELALARAVDNMISNAIEHGRGAVTVQAQEEEEGRLSIAVVDSGSTTASLATRLRPRLRTRISGRNRRGHGLRIVERVAKGHGGAFELRRGGDGAEARLELPLRRRGAEA
jgi:two-component system sensor histidine kinase TctE